MLTGISAEYDNVKQGVTHKTVTSVNAADSLARNEQILDLCGHTVNAYVKTAVLIVKRRINENGLFSYIYAVTCEHTHHRGNASFYRALPAYRFYHRSIEPYGLAAARVNTFIPVGAFSDNRSRRNVTGFKRVHENLTVTVDKLCAERTNLFGYERAENLLRECRARRVILKSIGIKKFCADTVTENKTVCCSAVVIGGREALIVHTSRAARCNNNRLCTSNHKFFCFHIHKNRARRFAVFIKYKFYCGSEVNNGNASVENLIAKRSHNLRAGIVLRGVHTLTGGSAAVRGYHGSVGSLIKLNAEIIEPLNCLGSVANKFCKKFALCGIVSAAVGVNEMYRGRIVGLVSRLNTALRHHRVGVADTQFCNYRRLCARIIGFNGSGRAGAAAADDKNVNVIANVVQINVGSLYTAVRLQHFAKLVGNFLALVRTDFKNGKLALFIVGVISRKEVFLFLSGHTNGFISDICFSCRFNGFQRRFKFF